MMYYIPQKKEKLSISGNSMMKIRQIMMTLR